MCFFTDCKIGLQGCCANDFLEGSIPENKEGGGNCGDKEGDCDKDSECHDGMICGTNNCQNKAEDQFGMDCCYDPRNPIYIYTTF